MRALAAAAFVIAGAAGAESVPGALRFGEIRLEAAICGVRSTLWIEHYVAALYLPERRSALEELLDPTSAKALYVRILNDDHLPLRIPREWREPIVRHLSVDDLARARAAYRRLRPGDELFIAYLPDAGVRLVINDRLIASSSGHALVEAVLGTWTEGKPLGEKLREVTAENTCR